MYERLEPTPASDELVFCTQYRLRDDAALADYLREHAPRLRADGMARFGGRFNLTPIVDIFNVFNTVNLGNLSDAGRDANNVAFGTITTAQPPRQFQFGARFDF